MACTKNVDIGCNSTFAYLDNHKTEQKLREFVPIINFPRHTKNDNRSYC